MVADRWLWLAPGLMPWYLFTQRQVCLLKPTIRYACDPIIQAADPIRGETPTITLAIPSQIFVVILEGWIELPKCAFVQLKDGRPVTTSRTVAKVFEKRNDQVLRDIEALDCSQDFRDHNFVVYSYKPEGAKRSYPMYEITRDGFVFLCMGFTGKKAARRHSLYQFKEQYIAEFKCSYVQLKNGVPVTNSVTVALVFNKRHDNVLQAVQQLDCSEEFSLLNFKETSLKDSQNKDRRTYDMTRDGFMFLVMGFTGKVAGRYKEHFIAEFVSHYVPPGWNRFAPAHSG